MKCPSCGGEVETPMVDIGVGNQRCGEDFCPSCGWTDNPPETGFWALDRKQLRIDALDGALAKSEAMTARWKKAVEGLTPSGSEYVDDPERCAVFIHHRSAYPPIIARLQKELAEARAEIERLREAPCNAPK